MNKQSSNRFALDGTIHAPKIYRHGRSKQRSVAERRIDLTCERAQGPGRCTVY